MTARKFTLRIEEMPVVGGFLLRSFEANISEFQAYSPDFNPAYKAAFRAKLETVESIVNPKKLQGELKKVTDDMYASTESFRAQLQLLEGYIKRAENLTILPKDFGISALRKNIAKKDQEAILENLKVLFQNIDANLAAIQAKGFTAAAYDKLKSTRDSIKTANLSQNEKMNQKQKLVEENIGILNELWDIMNNIMDAGKRIAKSNTKLRIDDYTKTKLQKRVRHVSTKPAISQEPTVENPQ
jgi:translation elongation factor EF-1beta